MTDPLGSSARLFLSLHHMLYPKHSSLMTEKVDRVPHSRNIYDHMVENGTIGKENITTLELNSQLQAPQQ
jgi:hypothetical protein